MQNKILFFLLIIFISNSILAYNPGDQLTNLYVGGLNLRKEPAKDSRLLATIAYGETVQFLEITKNRFETDNLKGFWIKVKYKNKEGYLFDGYLTSFPAPDIKYIKGEAEITMQDYLNQYLQGKGKASCQDKNGNVRQSLWLPGTQNLQEGFLIAKLLNYRIFGGYKYPVAWKNYTTSNNEKITMGNHKTSVFIKIELLDTKAKASLQIRICNGGLEITSSSEVK